MDQKKQNELYANLMDEVKARIDCILSAAEGRMVYPAPVVREFCYLQLRMLCEVIALSCLVAHGDITFLQSNKLGRSYSADEILDRLTKLRPEFYPHQCKQIKWGDGWTFEIQDPSPLPKEKLLELYGKTHSHLHRGSLKKLLSSDMPIDVKVNMPEIMEWTQKIHDLLSLHLIVINKDNMHVCMLRNAEDNNRVQVASLSTKPPA